MLGGNQNHFQKKSLKLAIEREIVEVEAQIFDTGQVPQKIVLKSYN
jgi:hypothetical protein